MDRDSEVNRFAADFGVLVKLELVLGASHFLVFCLILAFRQALGFRGNLLRDSPVRLLTLRFSDHYENMAERVGFYPRQSSRPDSLALVGSLPQHSANKAFIGNQ